MDAQSFRIEVSDEVLTDLIARLRRTRYSRPEGDGQWVGGVGAPLLRRWVERWANEFDWRQRERALNEVEQYSVDVGGHRLHLARIRPADAERPAAPLLLLHGWPSAFTEYLPLGRLLAAGADGGPQFDVIVPSLPGFVFSELPEPPVTRRAMAADIHRAVTEGLGVGRYGAYGGDIGGGVAVWLAHDHPEAVIGLQMFHPPFPADLADLSAEEQAFVEGEDAYDETDGGYSAIMSTRPDTIAAALADSPAGLLAWIIDKWHDWVDGDLEQLSDPDDLLTIATLYWVTGSIGSSFRQYYDWSASPPRPRVPVPLSVRLSNEPGLREFPQSLTERTVDDLREFIRVPVGGHFPGLEQLDATAAGIRSFFGDLE